MLRFGFELEGFYEIDGVVHPEREVSIPPKNYPTDGFPGLVELRTTGHHSLEDAYAGLVCENLSYPEVNYMRSEGVFTPKQRAELRRRWNNKSAWDIQNIYGKDPRALGNKVIASFQINISNRTSARYRNKDGVLFPDRFGLFDVPRIVKDLDAEFEKEIKAAKRQPGEYCVKDDTRLEYRSLPNSVFSFYPDEGRKLLTRLNKVFGTKE